LETNLDLTLHQVGVLMEQLKMRLPLPADKMPDRGWRKVAAGKAPDDRRKLFFPPSPVKTVSSADEDSSHLRMVFHAPSRRVTEYTPASRCINNLFQWAHRGSYSPGLYQLRPTMEWYHIQMTEGRGFSHIKVAPWEEIFTTYKIHERQKN
jgi:chromo domain-containing protein 1